MAVELEKIASLLDGAHEQIEALESERDQLLAKVSEMEEAMSLLKQAEENVTSWDSSASIGGESVNIPSSYESAESRLDSFLFD